MRPISDYKIGERITMMYFDEPTEMRVADYSVDAGMVKIEFINANGASWYTAEQIEDHQKRIRNYYASSRRLFDMHNDIDANGNCYSDADPGL